MPPPPFLMLNITSERKHIRFENKMTWHWCFPILCPRFLLYDRRTTLKAFSPLFSREWPPLLEHRWHFVVYIVEDVDYGDRFVDGSRLMKKTLRCLFSVFLYLYSVCFLFNWPCFLANSNGPCMARADNTMYVQSAILLSGISLFDANVFTLK